MSLINDMLRDLEARRAAPTERLQLNGLHAVDEAAESRRTRWFGVAGVVLLALVLGGLALWLVLARPDLRTLPPALPNPALPVPALPVSALPVSVSAVPVSAVPVSAVPVPALPVPASPTPTLAVPDIEPAPALPAALASTTADNTNDHSPPQVSIAPSVPDALMLARQMLQAGDYPRAIHALEALQQRRNMDPEVTRWLARAYLAGGESAQLLSWLPARLAQWPQDSDLRVLLARGQLLAGQPARAVSTLQDSPPSLRQQPTYHALLAASYQQTGEWQHSAALYRQLIKLQPSQSSWQLGLGIALEQLAQFTAAAQHYHLAQQGPGLDEGARRFANERAAALGARP